MLSRHAFIAGLLICVACSDSVAATASDETAAPIVAAAAAPAASAQAPASEPAAVKAEIRGTIKFEGEVPAPAAVDLSPDPVCHELHGDKGMTSPVAVRKGANGGLADVFVQLTTGVPEGKYEAPETPVVLDQVGCTYEPHVFGVMKKQPIKILNSDATLHNIHAVPKSNKEFNLAMPNKGDVREQEFKKAEDAVLIKCDVHPWMACYAFVMEHPFFAVTGADGSFSIADARLADGEYGVKLWHEVLGEATGTVTVKDGVGNFEHAFRK